jgi:2-iminobutanoate/2-iminopropanoate deaminase
VNAMNREEFRVGTLPTPISHYTDAVRWGDMLFVSGCASIGANGQVVGPGDVTAQARVVHEYLGSALKAAGTDFAHVLKVTVFLLDAADRQAVNEVRKEFFGDVLPASTLIVVSALAITGLLVEIEAIAGIPTQ